MIWKIQRYLGLLVLFDVNFRYKSSFPGKGVGLGIKNLIVIYPVPKKNFGLRSVVYIFRQWLSISRDKPPWSVKHTPTFPLCWFHVFDSHTFMPTTWTLWCLILFCLLDWATGCPDSWLNTISVCVCEAVGEISIWIGVLSKPYGSPHCGAGQGAIC